MQEHWVSQTQKKYEKLATGYAANRRIKDETLVIFAAISKLASSLIVLVNPVLLQTLEFV